MSAALNIRNISIAASGRKLPCLPCFRQAGRRKLVLSPHQPTLNRLGTMLLFPRIQRLLVAATGFDDFAGVRVLVDLQLALGAAGTCGASGLGGGRLRVQQLDDVSG